MDWLGFLCSISSICILEGFPCEIDLYWYLVHYHDSIGCIDFHFRVPPSPEATSGVVFVGGKLTGEFEVFKH